MKNKLPVQSFVLTICAILLLPFAAGSPIPTLLSSLVLILTVAGFITGIVALKQVHKTKQGGKCLAIASIVISAAMLVFMVIGTITIVYFIINPPTL